MVAKEYAVALRAVSKHYKLYDRKVDRFLEAIVPGGRPRHRIHRALGEITVEIPAGETVGILGLNGSGKSTLLQIIAAVLQPTSGSLEVMGKVAALLELGAGFNPQLTGRENVSINCSLMGLSDSEIKDRISDIEAFAEIGAFFDQPMHVYSSGMYARVAFAAAIHVDPEILIIDEALAVGDVRFQEKCFARFQDFRDKGKTILYVSHDRNAVNQLCNHALLLHRGELIDSGNPAAVSRHYDSVVNAASSSRVDISNNSEESIPAPGVTGKQPMEVLGSRKTALGMTGRPMNENPVYNPNERKVGSGGGEITEFAIRCKGETNPTAVQSGQTCEITFAAYFHDAEEAPVAGVAIRNAKGILVYSINTSMLNIQTTNAPSGSERLFSFRIKLDLAPGEFFLDLAISRRNGEILQSRTAVASIRVTDDDSYGGLVHLDTEFSEILDTV